MVYLLQCFLFFVRRPPHSPLFPYTTLFRSLGRQARHHARREFRGLGGVDRVEGDEVGQGHGLLRGEVPGEQARDRKSTRLNSSHVRISYGVFCLKKKKTKLATLIVYRWWMS